MDSAPQATPYARHWSAGLVEPARVERLLGAVEVQRHELPAGVG